MISLSSWLVRMGWLSCLPLGSLMFTRSKSHPPPFTSTCTPLYRENSITTTISTYLLDIGDETHNFPVVYVEHIVGLDELGEFFIVAIHLLAVRLVEVAVACDEELLPRLEHYSAAATDRVDFVSLDLVINGRRPYLSASDFQHQRACLVRAQAFCFLELLEQPRVALQNDYEGDCEP
jgi:hypothetical protein